VAAGGSAGGLTACPIGVASWNDLALAAEGDDAAATHAVDNPVTGSQR
jgi:hypothetical protein